MQDLQVGHRVRFIPAGHRREEWRYGYVQEIVSYELLKVVTQSGAIYELRRDQIVPLSHEIEV